MRLTVQNLDAYYGSSHVLHGVSLEVGNGEAVALLGRNGAGKTTTLHSIVGIVHQTTGSIRLDDREIRARAPYQIAKMGVGLIPETRRIFPELTVLENLSVGVKDGTATTRWTIDQIFDLFPLLAGLKDRKGALLSGGEQQVLAIARTLVGNPDLLLLDEPAEGLAPRLVELLETQLLALRETGVSMLVSEQNLAFAIALTDRAYVIDKGAIQYEGPSVQLGKDRALREKYLAV